VRLQLERAVQTAVEPTPRVCQIAAMFGLGVDESRRVAIVPPLELDLEPGQVVFITGASGGGKSTLLRLIADRLAGCPDGRVIDFASPLPPDEGRSLVDALGGELEQAVRRLSLAGLNDAFVMLRRPVELSDGQRYRWRLAQAIQAAELAPSTGDPSGALTVVLADEFASTLDRLTAAVIARNVRKWTRRSGVCFVAATAHDDLLEPLEPDVLIVQHPGAGMEVHRRPAA
jgi:ABC-type ATPase with predicted acetyltransferase domain